MTIAKWEGLLGSGPRALSVAVFVMASLSILGCKREEILANVNCKVTPETTIACTVEQTKGESKVEVCWDFSITCANGASLTAERTCAKVQDGQSVSVAVPKKKITIEGACEGERTAVLDNLTLNGKASTK